MATAAARTMEDRIRRMTPVAAPPGQRAQVAALSRALEDMVHLPKRRAPKCQLVGPKGEAIALPESVFYGVHDQAARACSGVRLGAFLIAA